MGYSPSWAIATQEEMVRSYVRSAVATNSTYQNTKWVPWRKMRKGWEAKQHRDFATERGKRGRLENDGKWGDRWFSQL